MFADYNSFLELAVALNLLFSVWRTLWERLGSTMDRITHSWFIKHQRKARNFSRASNVGTPVLLMAGRWDLVIAMRRVIQLWARVIATVVIFFIMQALFFVGQETNIPTWGLTLIYFSPLAQPAFMLLVAVFVLLLYSIQVWLPFLIFRRQAIAAIGSVNDFDASPQHVPLNLSPNGLVFDENEEEVAMIVQTEPCQYDVIDLTGARIDLEGVRFGSTETAFNAVKESYSRS